MVAVPAVMEDQREVIAFLSEGTSYGTPGAAVRQIATHASIVFLTGERAYKLKRAVRFSYLDYSTPALREKYCRAELGLNRRTAPGLYLRVRTITREASGGLAFNGDGPLIDSVVEMRRFDEAHLFDQMAERHALTPRLMRDLADMIATFHGEAEATPGRGGSAGMAATLAVNDENLRLAAPPLDRGTINRLQATSTAHLARVGALLDARAAQGKVRRCHGDLHLRNICLFDGRPTLFDGIEFNDAFTCIDVLYDLAFLLMDLTQRGLGGLANLVFNRYLDRSGDIEGLPALPLFLATRAAVRAHVAGALLRSTEAEKRGEATAAAQSYLALALNLIEDASPRLLAIGGLSGSGKSTLAQAIAADFQPSPGARIIRSDVLRKRLMGLAPEARLPEASYTPAAAHAVYEALRREAAATLAAGYTAIVDATFLRREERQAIAAVAQDAGVRFTGLWLTGPAELLAARLDARRDDASDADRVVLERQRALALGALDWRRIDTSSGIDATIAAARNAL